MKTFKILFITITSLLIISCSEDIMDEINKDVNNALTMSAQSELPDVILKSAFETTGTDIAWYCTVYVEHQAGTWAQSSDADKRIGRDQQVHSSIITGIVFMTSLWSLTI